MARISAPNSLRSYLVIVVAVAPELKPVILVGVKSSPSSVSTFPSRTSVLPTTDSTVRSIVVLLPLIILTTSLLKVPVTPLSVT